MTTIAYSNRKMVSDSRCTNDETHVTRVQKLHQLTSGAILGVAGDADSRDVVNLLDRVKNASQIPTRKEIAAVESEFDAILVLPNEMVWAISAEQLKGAWSGEAIEIREPFYAVGSGASYALALLKADYPLEKAVQVACHYDLNSALPLQTLLLPAKKPRKR